MTEVRVSIWDFRFGFFQKPPLIPPFLRAEMGGDLRDPSAAEAFPTGTGRMTKRGEFSGCAWGGCVLLVGPYGMTGVLFSQFALQMVAFFE